MTFHVSLDRAVSGNDFPYRQNADGQGDGMPSFELVVLLRKMERPALKEALKRSAQYIFDEDGTIRRMENLGLRELPYLLRKKGRKHGYGQFFIFSYDSSFEKIKPIKEKFKLDVDVLKANNILVASSPLGLHLEKKKPECTLYEDLLPPPLRPSIIAMQATEKKSKKGRNMPNTNFDDVEYLIL